MKWEGQRQVTSTPFVMIPIWVLDAIPEDGRYARHLRVYTQLRRMARHERAPRSVEDVQTATGLSRAAVYDSLSLFMKMGALCETDDEGERSWFLPVDNPSTLVDTTRRPSTPVDTSGPSVHPGGSVPFSLEVDLKVNHVERGSPVPSDPQGVEDLCTMLADRVAAHRSTGARPVVTQKWRTDMRLLLERGPLHVEAAKPLEAQRVARAIEVVFTELNEHGRDGFCWADQVRSPYALRDHWVQLAEAARRAHATTVSRGTAVLDRRDNRDRRDGGGPARNGATSVLAGTHLDPTRAIDVQAKGDADG